MSDWSDQRSPTAFGRTGTAGRTAEYDAGLRSYMLKVYNYMASGVLLTGIVAMMFSWGGVDSPAAQIFMSGGLLSWVIILSPLAIVFAMSGVGIGDLAVRPYKF